MKPSHHNTTNESGQVLEQYESKAKSQQDKILDLFIVLKQASPSYIGAIINQVQITPLTSIRRAISNLTRDGYLIKTDKKVIGLYNRPEFQWKLNQGEIVPEKKKAPQIALKTLKKDFEQLELKFADVSMMNCDLMAQVETITTNYENLQIIRQQETEALKKVVENICDDNAKLKQAVDICHEQIEKDRKTLIGKEKEIDFLHRRIDELNKELNKLKK